MKRPRVLDLCCGVGGTSVGLHRAGWDVDGVDIDPQPDYPFSFVQGDAFEYLAENHRLYDALVAGWPCQASTALTKGTNKGREYPQLIPTGRVAMRETGLPFVIENVAGAPIRKDLMLCGEMFGLRVLRHRFFEGGNGVDFDQPEHPKHRGRVAGWRHGQFFDGPYLAVYGEGGGKGSVADWKEAMGIDWTDSRKSIAEAIPPAFGEYVGRQLLESLRQAA